MSRAGVERTMPMDEELLNEVYEANKSYIKRIEESDELKQLWKSRWNAIVNSSEKDDVFTAIRLLVRKTGVYEGPTPYVVNQRYNFFDPTTRWVYFSPTTNKKHVPTFARCIEIAHRSKEERSLIKIGIITKEGGGIVEGFDLGWYRVHTICDQNFSHLEPQDLCESVAHTIPIECDEMVGTKVVYKGQCMESLGEARFARLLDCMGVPYKYEMHEHRVSLVGNEFQNMYYLVDFTLWPESPKKMCFVEWKASYPTLEEQDKMSALVRSKGVTGYIAWGRSFTQSILKRKSQSDDRCNADGIRLMKFMPVLDDGHVALVRRREGYFLSASNSAKGLRWTEMTDVDASETQTVYTFNVVALRRLLAKNCRKITKKKWTQMKLPGRVRADTRVVVEDAEGRRTVFGPTDRGTLTFTNDPHDEGCMSETLHSALQVASSYTFESHL